MDDIESKMLVPPVHVILHMGDITGKGKIASIKDIKELESKKIKRVYMIVGEGTVFMLILLFGIIKVRRSIKKEADLNEQQKINR